MKVRRFASDCPMAGGGGPKAAEASVLVHFLFQLERQVLDGGWRRLVPLGGPKEAGGYVTKASTGDLRDEVWRDPPVRWWERLAIPHPVPRMLGSRAFPRLRLPTRPGPFPLGPLDLGWSSGQGRPQSFAERPGRRKRMQTTGVQIGVNP